MLRNSWVIAQLEASQERFSSMKLMYLSNYSLLILVFIRGIAAPKYVKSFFHALDCSRWRPFSSPRCFVGSRNILKNSISCDTTLCSLLKASSACYLLYWILETLVVMWKDHFFRFICLFYFTDLLYIICRTCNKCIYSINTCSWMSYAQWSISYTFFVF
jgi:hypothetical protein